MKPCLQFPTCAAAPSGGRAAGVKPKIYGRADDLRRLRSMYEVAMVPPGGYDCELHGVCSGSDGCITFITGLAGVGKSALIHELINGNQVQSNRLIRRRSSNESRGQNKLPFMHVSLSFTDVKTDDSCEMGSSFLEFHQNVEKMAQFISKEVTARRNDQASGKRQSSASYYQESSSSSDDSSGSDDESFSDEDLFDSPQQEKTASTQSELDELLSAHPSKTKESLHDILTYICKYVTQPLLMFFDNLDCLDKQSFDVLAFILSSPLPNSLIICASRPICSASDHPMQALLQMDLSPSRNVEIMTVNPLPLDVITKFTADSIKKETHEAAIVASAIYGKTMGIISKVMEALKESTDKNVLYYDPSVEDWRWEIAKVDLVTDYVSLDASISEYINCRLAEISTDARRMMILMSCFSADIKFQASLLMDLMSIGGVPLDEKTINDHAEWASSEGFLVSAYSSSSETFQFAHPIIREACQKLMSVRDRQDLACKVFRSRFDKWNKQRPHSRWSKKEMTFLIEFLNLLDFSPGSRRPGGSRRTKGQLSKSMGPSVSPLSKEDGRDVRLSDCSVKSVPAPVEIRKKRGGSRRTGTAVALSKSMGDISDLRNLEISVPDQFDEQSDNEPEPTKSTIIELLSDKVASIPARPLNTKKQVTDYLFFPHINDPKSWLVKHGSVVLESESGATQNAGDNERELMIFTHGFIVIDVALKDVFRLFFALGDQEFLTVAILMDYLKSKLHLNSSDDIVDGEKLYECLYELDVAKPRNLVIALFKDRSKLDAREFQDALQGFLSKKHSAKSCWEGLANETKVESAKLFSHVARVDSLSIAHSDDPRSMELFDSDQADFSLSVTMFEDRDEPFYFTFATTKDRESWLQKFGEKLILAWENSSDAELLKMQTRIGWQHLVVRSSPITYVIMNDHNGLEKCLNKTHADLDLLDEYNGYSAMHYATILDNEKCVEVLLRSGASAALHDKDGLSPMIHAVALGHDGCADLIEAYGSKRKDAIKSVDEDEQLRKAAIKATSESLRSLEMSDSNVTALTNLCISCPSRMSCPPVSQREETSTSHSARQSPQSEPNQTKYLTAAASILRGVHERVPTIPRTTSLENFKNSTPAARRVSWADVLGLPGSLRTIVTYELSESDDEDDDSSVGITDTSTTQETSLSDEEDDTNNTVKALSESVDETPTASPQLPPRRSSRRMAASIGRSLLGRPKTSLQPINSNSSIEISDQSDDDDSASNPHVNSIHLTDPSILRQPTRRKSNTMASIGRTLLGRSEPVSTNNAPDNRTPQPNQLFDINPESLEPTRLSSSATAASNIGRALLRSRPKIRRTSD